MNKKEETSKPATLQEKLQQCVGDKASVVEGYVFGQEPAVPCVAIVIADNTTLVVATSGKEENDALTNSVSNDFDVISVSPLYGGDAVGRVWRKIIIKHNTL